MKKKRTVGFSTFEHCLKKELNEQRFVLGPMPLFIAAREGGERPLWEAGLLHSIICVNTLPIKHVWTHFCNDLQKENTFICLIVIYIRGKNSHGINKWLSLRDGWVCGFAFYFQILRTTEKK